MNLVSRTLLQIVFIGSLLLGFSHNAPQAQSAKLEIKTLSSRPDLVSGGDALIEVKAPMDAKPLILTLNGKEIAHSLKHDPATNSFRGLISGLKNGDNTLAVKVATAQASLKLTNYPLTGPILSGPHLTPYECRTVESGLGEPLDANCSAKPKIEYFYRTTANAFKPLPDPVTHPQE